MACVLFVCWENVHKTQTDRCCQFFSSLWIILNLLSRYLWRKSFSLFPHSKCTHKIFLPPSMFDSRQRKNAGLTREEKKIKNFLILIRCPFCFAHKINACTLLLIRKSTFYCFCLSLTRLHPTSKQLIMQLSFYFISLLFFSFFFLLSSIWI